MQGLFGGGGKGGPPQPAAATWDDMYFHQKMKHLADAAGDQIFAMSRWWMPAIAVSSAVTVMLFSGPMGLPQLLQAGTMVASPIPAPSNFGMEMQMPGGGGGGGGGAPDDMEDEDL